MSTELIAIGVLATNKLTDQLPPFEEWDATAPGCLDVHVFDQHRIWVDALRVPHLITDRADMTDDYLHTH